MSEKLSNDVLDELIKNLKDPKELESLYSQHCSPCGAQQNTGTFHPNAPPIPAQKISFAPPRACAFFHVLRRVPALSALFADQGAG